MTAATLLSQNAELREQYRDQMLRLTEALRVMRDDRLIATLRVVDVRQKICGAVMQELGSEKDKTKVGDTLQVDARQSVTLK